jgi:hypothetical protein
LVGLFGRKLTAFVFDDKSTLLNRCRCKQAEAGTGTSDTKRFLASHATKAAHQRAFFVPLMHYWQLGPIGLDWTDQLFLNLILDRLQPPFCASGAAFEAFDLALKLLDPIFGGSELD